MRNYISICKNISEPATARFHPRQVRFARRICNELGAVERSRRNMRNIYLQNLLGPSFEWSCGI